MSKRTELTGHGRTAAARYLAAAAICGVAALFAEPGLAQSSQRTTPEPADLGFRVCNRTGGHIEVAKGLYTGESGGPAADFITEGWYQLDNDKCVMLWPGKLKYRYYLIYAQNKKTRREWAGDIGLCVSRQPFTIRAKRCGADKYRRMFFQVDTGESESWTHNLRP